MKIHEINAIKIRKQVPSQHVILATRIRESFDFLSVSQTHHSPIKINKNNEIRFLNKVLSSFSARLYSPPLPLFFPQISLPDLFPGFSVSFYTNEKVASKTLMGYIISYRSSSSTSSYTHTFHFVF